MYVKQLDNNHFLIVKLFNNDTNNATL